MANFDIYLEAPVKGASPYKDVFTPVLAGTEVFRIFAGRIKDRQNQHWEVHSGIFHLTCSADAANRTPTTKLYRDFGPYGVVNISGASRTPAVTASQTAALIFDPEYAIANGYSNVGTNAVVTVGSKFMLKGTDYITFSVGSGHANDLIYAMITFKYLNYDQGIKEKV